MDADSARASYDAVADRYTAEFFDELDRKPLDRQLLDVFAARLAGQNVLDVGCGPGHVARYLNDRGVRASGCDLSPEMISIARRLNPGMSFAVADMRALDPDLTVTGIVAFYSIIHLAREEVPAVLAGFRRAVGEGGRILLSVHGGEGSMEKDEFMGIAARWEGTLFALGELVTIVEAAGFTVDAAHQRPPYDFEHPTPRIYVSARAVPVQLP